MAPSQPGAAGTSIDHAACTVSGMYNRKFQDGTGQTTLAWGQNDLAPGTGVERVFCFSFGIRASWHQHTVFARAENDEKNELFTPPSPLAGRSFSVASFSLGYVYDVPVGEHLSLVWAAWAVFTIAARLDAAYGVNPMSYVLFTRLKLK